MIDPTKHEINIWLMAMFVIDFSALDNISYGVREHGSTPVVDTLQPDIECLERRVIVWDN